MAIQVSTERTVNKNGSQALKRAFRKRLEDSADRGFAESQRRAPVDRGTLQQSGYTPTWDGDTLHWGYRADHAKPMEFGTEPFWPPIQPLKGWANRVLGDESAAYAIQKKIAKHGINAQPFARPGRDAQVRFLKSNDLAKYLKREFR